MPEDLGDKGIASAMTAIWRSNTISFASKFKLHKAPVVSVLRRGCDARTLLADSEKRIQSSDNECRRKLLRISYVEYKTNDWVQDRINSLVDPQGPFLATFKRRKFTRFRHVTRYHSLSKILQSTFEDRRRRGRPRKRWIDNVKAWTTVPMPDLPTIAFHRKSERGSALNRP